MRKLLIAAALVLSAFIIRDAHATSITLDPSKGQTLETWAAHPDKAVTEITLLPGNHGKPTLIGVHDLYIHGDYYSTFVGKTVVVYSSNISFRWIKWRGLKNGDNDWKNALFYTDSSAPNVQVWDCSFAAADDTSKWSDADWLSLPYGQLIYSNSPGAVFANSEMFNTFSVMSINGDGWVVARNKMHDFVNDAMAFRGSNVWIDDNRITDSHDLPSNPLHADGIQGMAPNGDKQPYTNVHILGNYVDAGSKTTSPMQGISAFDGKWKNVEIKGNYVRPRAYHGITWSGVDGIFIDQNTVDQFRDSSGKPIERYPDLPMPWIQVQDGTGLTIGRNVTPRYVGNSIAAMKPLPIPATSLP